MTNTKKFEATLILKEKTKKDIAELLGVTLQTVYNKINNSVDFKGKEISAIVKFLNLSTEEMSEIFFAKDVDN